MLSVCLDDDDDDFMLITQMNSEEEFEKSEFFFIGQSSTKFQERTKAKITVMDQNKNPS